MDNLQMDVEPNPPTNQTSSSKQRDSFFETTHWSAVLMAAEPSSPEADRALAELCQTYWMPLYAYVRCRVGDASHAQDLTQTFFAKLLEKDYLRLVDPAKGRFRAFLLTAINRLIANDWDRRTALKRGGGHVHLSLDFEAADVHFGRLDRRALTAEQVFLQDWVRALLDRVFERLKHEFEAAGKAEEFSHFKGFITLGEEETRVSEVAEKMGITAGAARVAIHRLRRRYRQILHQQVAETVMDLSEIDDEIRSLFAAFE
jgi:RNA polymerase sigma-70 factor (ECF subfamily)